jgi:hypothetical protein
MSWQALSQSINKYRSLATGCSRKPELACKAVIGGTKTMWLYTELGFYSIIHKQPCNRDELLVRTRSKIDIDKLKQKLKAKYQFDGEIIDSPKADYAYRMIVSRKIFSAFVADAVMEIDYDNFKNTVPRMDYKRHEAYMNCWEAMYEWQRDLERCNFQARAFGRNEKGSVHDD